MKKSLRTRNKRLKRWLEQGKYCPICKQLNTQETGWHAHPMVRSVDYGKGGMSNLITILHPNGHHQIHAGDVKMAYKSDLMNNGYALQH